VEVLDTALVVIQVQVVIALVIHLFHHFGFQDQVRHHLQIAQTPGVLKNLNGISLQLNVAGSNNEIR
jgi:hypothetical protein